MSSRLIRALGKEESKAIKVYLDSIVELLEKDLQSSYSNMRKDANFANTAWAYEQAMYVGEQKTLSKVIELLTIK